MAAASRFTYLFLLVIGLVAGLLNDYHNHFCGKKHDCYELLGVSPDADLREIKKAFRTLSLKWHPDKNRAPGAKKHFQLLSKAYEVMSNETHRALYDHLKENPSKYAVHYGHIFFSTYAPQTNTLLVIIGLLAAFSAFTYAVQWNKHKHACDYLVTAALKGWGLREGGTKETLEIRSRALEMREEFRAQAKTAAADANANGSTSKASKEKGKVKKVKDEDDPDLRRFVEGIVSEMDIQGGCRKPTYHDLLIVWLAYLPINLSKWVYFQVNWYYKHSVKKLPLSEEEEEYLLVRLIGRKKWEELEGEEKGELLGEKIWEDSEWRYEVWKEEKEMGKMKPNQLKKYLRNRKRQQQAEENEGDDE